MEESEHFSYEEEEEEFTTFYRKTKRTHSTTKKKRSKGKGKEPSDAVVKTEIKLNPFLVGTGNREKYNKPEVPPEGLRKADFVQKLVKDTLNAYKGSDLPELQKSNRLFLGECDYDDDENDDDVTKFVTQKKGVWKFTQTGRKGLDRFRRVVEFVILAKQLFTCRRSVPLNRRDSILFFMDREVGSEQNKEEGSESEPKFDLSSFKSIGQKTKTASVKTSLQVPPSERSDAQVNQMVHMMRSFSRFSSYPQAVQTGLCKQGWYAKFESSKVLVKEGNKAEFYYLILSGLAIYRDIGTTVDESNNEQNSMVASYLKPGDTLGEKEILTNAERTATVVCKEPVEVLGVDRDTLLDIFKASGGIRSIDYLKTIPQLIDFPLELLQTYHFSMAVHYYRRGTVIVKNSNESEWIYIVRSGSCQVYKAIKDGHKSIRDTEKINPLGSTFVGHLDNTSSSLSRNNGEETGLTFPSIHKVKNDLLKSASTDNIAEIFQKKQKKKKTAGLERSHTIMLPSLTTGKHSLVQKKTQESKRFTSNTPTLPLLNQNRSKENNTPRQNKNNKGSPKLSRKKHNNTPEILRMSRNHTTLCETPDSCRNSRLGHFDSISSHSKIEIDIKKNSLSSDSDLNTNSSSKHRKSSNHSTDSVFGYSDLKNNSFGGSKESVMSLDVGGSLFYVRLGIVSENDVFGMHPLVFDNMPNLSLVSNGAECVLISKQFLKAQINSSIAHSLRSKLSPYPNSGQLRSALDDQINWGNYRERVVSDVVG